MNTNVVHFLWAFLFAIVISLTPVALLNAEETDLKPPVAEKIAKVDTLFGQECIDDYFWLRDKNDEKVIDYLKAENAYTEAVLKHTEQLQEDIYDEMLSRIKETDLSVPEKLDDYYYYSRTEEGREYRIYCRKQGSLEGEEEVLLDQNKLAQGHDYFYIGVLAISPDHSLLAYSVDTLGSERYTVYVKNLASGQLLPDQIPNTSYSLKWALDNKTMFYTTRDDANRPFKVWRHQLGTDAKDDVMIYHEPDDRMWLGVSRTKDKKFIMIEAGSHTTTEYQILDATDPLGEFKLVAPRKQNVEYYLSHHNDKFFILTNEDATNFKLMEVSATDPTKENWKEFIPHRENVKIDNMEVFADYLVLEERENGLQTIRIRSFKNGGEHYVEFPEPVYSFSMGANRDFNHDKIRFTYESLVTPRSIYDYDMNSRGRELLKEYEVVGDFDKANYNSERVFAKASDGAMVPVSMVYHKDTPIDGSAPLYLYSYGAYGSSMDPYFSSVRLTLLNRGYIFAIAHIRGGGEMGRKWYEQGKMKHKMNTFTDLIACADHLIANKYTSRERLTISGGSAGGLTVGAAMNMRPDLFAIVVAEVPFVDVINTMLDKSIPLTVIEYEEWGNPHIKDQYDYIMQYSPYDNVTAQDYPNILITTSLNDPRVAFWEPAKWAAKLRVLKTDNNRLLLRTNMEAGHGGSSGRYQRLKEIALEYAFIFDLLGTKF